MGDTNCFFEMPMLLHQLFLFENQSTAINTLTNQKLMHFNQHFSASIEMSNFLREFGIRFFNDKMLNDINVFVFPDFVALMEILIVEMYS